MTVFSGRSGCNKKRRRFVCEADGFCYRCAAGPAGGQRANKCVARAVGVDQFHRMSGFGARGIPHIRQRRAEPPAVPTTLATCSDSSAAASVASGRFVTVTPKVSISTSTSLTTKISTLANRSRPSCRAGAALESRGHGNPRLIALLLRLGKPSALVTQWADSTLKFPSNNRRTQVSVSMISVTRVQIQGATPLRK